MLITGGTNRVAENLSTNNIYTRKTGTKNYELKDHLGSVRAVVTDEMTFNISLTTHNPQLTTTIDYYSYGSYLSGRTYNTTENNYGYQGKPKDDELKGNGNSYDFGARLLDTRVGRWLSIDPLENQFPSMSTYNAMVANPINFIDPDGRATEASLGFYSNSSIPASQGDKELLIKMYKMYGEVLAAAFVPDEIDAMLLSAGLAEPSPGGGEMAAAAIYGLRIPVKLWRKVDGMLKEIQHIEDGAGIVTVRWDGLDNTMTFDEFHNATGIRDPLSLIGTLFTKVGIDIKNPLVSKYPSYTQFVYHTANSAVQFIAVRRGVNSNNVYFTAQPGFTSLQLPDHELKDLYLGLVDESLAYIKNQGGQIDEITFTLSDGKVYNCAFTNEFTAGLQSGLDIGGAAMNTSLGQHINSLGYTKITDVTQMGSITKVTVSK